MPAKSSGLSADERKQLGEALSKKLNGAGVGVRKSGEKTVLVFDDDAALDSFIDHMGVEADPDEVDLDDDESDENDDPKPDPEPDPDPEPEPEKKSRKFGREQKPKKSQEQDPEPKHTHRYFQ